MQVVFIICGALGALGLIVGSGVFLRWFNNQIGRYFLRYASEEQKRALANASVAYKESWLSSSDTEPGIFIKAKSLDKALEAMGSYVVTTYPSMRRRVHELVVRPTQTDNFAGQFTITGPVFDNNANEIVKRLVNELVIPHVRSNVQVFNQETRVALPQNEQGFYIFLNSAMQRTGRGYLPSRFFGVARNESDWTVEAPHTGVPFTHEGFTYGELYGNALYLFVNFGDLTGDRLALLTRLLQHCGAELDIEKMIADVLSTVPAATNNALAARPASIFDEGFTTRRKAIVRALTQAVLGPVVQSHIHVRDCAGSQSVSYRDEMFHVLHWALPSGGQIPSGRGVPITDNDGLIVGELIDDTLYSYRPHLKLASRSEAESYARFLVLARDEIAVERSPLVDATQTDRFSEACVSQVRTYAKLPTDPVKLTQNLEASDKQLKVLLSETLKARSEEYNLGNAHETTFGKEFDDLFRIAKVRDVTVTDSEITVETTTLFCRNPLTNILHRIGEFQIVLTFRGEVRLWNKAGALDLGNGVKMHAPHVNSGGTVCFGNTKDQFPELIANREYASAVNLAILFLESVNIGDSWGKSLALFPVAYEGPRGAS